MIIVSNNTISIRFLLQSYPQYNKQNCINSTTNMKYFNIWINKQNITLLMSQHFWIFPIFLCIYYFITVWGCHCNNINIKKKIQPSLLIAKSNKSYLQTDESYFLLYICIIILLQYGVIVFSSFIMVCYYCNCCCCWLEKLLFDDDDVDIYIYKFEWTIKPYYWKITLSYSCERCMNRTKMIFSITRFFDFFTFF